jgi:hypothetical protein
MWQSCFLLAFCSWFACGAAELADQAEPDLGATQRCARVGGCDGDGGSDAVDAFEASFLQRATEMGWISQPGDDAKAAAESMAAAAAEVPLSQLAYRSPRGLLHEAIRREWDGVGRGWAHKANIMLQIVQHGAAATNATDEVKAYGVTLSSPDFYSEYMWMTAVSFAIWLPLMILFVNFCYPPYHHIDEDDRTKLEKNVWQMWENGLFDCFFELDMKIWFCSTFCMIAMWSETVGKSLIHGYWTAFFAFAVCAFLNQATYCWAYLGFFTLCLQLYFRQRLRSKLGDTTAWSCDTMVEDCCFAACCPCAVVAHEAQVIELAVEQKMYGFV